MTTKKMMLLGTLISSSVIAQDNSARPGFTPSLTAPATETRGINSEGFDDITTLAGDGWIQDNQSNPLGTLDWFQGNDTVFPSQAGAANAYIAANFNSTTGSDICNWLILPDLGYLQSVSFWTTTVAASTFPDRLVVLHSPTGGTTTGTCFGGFGDFTNSLLEINPSEAQGGYPEAWTQFTVNPNATGRVALVYWVSDGGPAGNNSNYIGVDTVEWVAGAPEADVGVIKSNNSTVNTVTGDSVTYSLSASNNGPADASNTVVTDVLPAGVSYVSNTCGASEAAGTVTWNIGALANAANASCDIVVNVDNSGLISNTASISADENDTNAANDSSTSDFSAGVPEADISITVTNDSPGVLDQGDTVIFTTTVTNNGPGTANNTAVSSSFDDGLSYISNTCGATAGANSLSWNVGSLANGASSSCGATFTVDGFGRLNLNASASADEADSVSSNNNAGSGVNGPAQIIPTLGQYGLMLLLIGMIYISRRKFIN